MVSVEAGKCAAFLPANEPSGSLACILQAVVASIQVSSPPTVMTIGKQCLAGTSQPRCIMKYPPQRLLCATKSNNTNSTGAILQTKRHR